MRLSEGNVSIDITSNGTGTADVQTRSTRTAAVSQLCAGQPVNSPLVADLMSTLFSLCPHAHRIGYEQALAAALAHSEVPRYLPVRYEMITEHLRFLAFDAPSALHLKTDPAVKNLTQLRLLFAQHDAYGETPDRDVESALLQAVEYFIVGGSLSGFHALDSLPDFEAWMHSESCIAARLFSAIWENVPCRGTPAVPQLSYPLSARQVAAWFTDSFDELSPAIDGRRYQTGSLARSASAHLLMEIQEQYRCFIREAFAARLIDLMALTRGEARLACLCDSARTAPHSGVSVVQTARGHLVTHLQLTDDDKTIRALRFAAPTEWNFAPGSIAQAVLAQIPLLTRSQYSREALWALLAVDPCVPYQLHFHSEAESHA